METFPSTINHWEIRSHTHTHIHTRARIYYYHRTTRRTDSPSDICLATETLMRIVRLKQCRIKYWGTYAFSKRDGHYSSWRTCCQHRGVDAAGICWELELKSDEYCARCLLAVSSYDMHSALLEEYKLSKLADNAYRLVVIDN